MKNWLNSRQAARFLLVFSSIICSCFWVPPCWNAICKVFCSLSLRFPDTFFGTLFALGLFPLVLAALSFPCGKRFPSLFRGHTILLGLIYSALCAACCHFFFLPYMMLGFGTADNHPVQMKAAAILFLVSMTLLCIVLFVDMFKLRPTDNECGARLFICAAYFLSFLLSYNQIWGWLCQLADNLK